MPPKNKSIFAKKLIKRVKTHKIKAKTDINEVLREIEDLLNVARHDATFDIFGNVEHLDTHQLILKTDIELEEVYTAKETDDEWAIRMKTGEMSEQEERALLQTLKNKYEVCQTTAAKPAKRKLTL